MLAVPVVLPVTIPVGSTDALASTVHVPPALPDAERVVTDPGQTLFTPDMVPATAGVLIVVANVLTAVPQLLVVE